MPPDHFCVHDLQAFRDALDACTFGLEDVTLLLRQYPRRLAAMVATARKEGASAAANH